MRPLLAALLLAGCHRAPPAPDPADCGADRGEGIFEVVRRPAEGEGPRACLLARLERCAPGRFQHLDRAGLPELQGEVLAADGGGCGLRFTGPQGTAECRSQQVVHRVPAGQARGAPDPRTDRLLLGDCSDGHPHLL